MCILINIKDVSTDFENLPASVYFRLTSKGARQLSPTHTTSILHNIDRHVFSCSTVTVIDDDVKECILAFILYQVCVLSIYDGTLFIYNTIDLIS